SKRDWSSDVCSSDLRRSQESIICSSLSFLLFQKILHIFGQHKGADMQMCGVIPGFNFSCVPYLGPKVLDGMVLFRREAKQPVAQIGRASCRQQEKSL